MNQVNNSQLSEFGIIFLFIISGILFAGLVMITSKILRPHRPNEEKLTSYECGEDPVGNAWGQFNMRFYIIALIFILFEVEVVFLFPWATVFGNKKLIAGTDGLWAWFSITEMFIFIGILALGLAYAWARGYLDWVKPDQEITPFKSPVPKKLYEDINTKYSGKKTLER